MGADSDLGRSRLCDIHVSHEDEWARIAISLDGAYTGGALVETIPDFTGSIEGRDEVAIPYTLSNWLAGITSGALYAFRALKLARRRLFLSRLTGSLRGSSMQALANGTAVGVAMLSGRDAPSLDTNGWRIDCEISSCAERSGRKREEHCSDIEPQLSPIANGASPRQVLVALAFQALIEGGISDPDVRRFNSVMRGDVESLQAALASGADPNTTDGEVIRRHADSLIKPPVSERLAAALVRALVSPTPAGPDAAADGSRH